MAARVLLLLDLAIENPIAVDEVATQMGAGSIPTVLRVTEFGATATARGSVLDWPRTSRAVARMVAAARAAHEADRTAEFFVAGRAGLPIFAQLGLELSKWAAVTILNRRPDGTWDKFEVGTATGTSLLTVSLPRTPSEASGRVAVAISVGQRVDDAQVRAFAELQGAALAGIVHAAGPNLLEPAQSSGLAQELVELIASVKRSFPHVTGVSLHVAGPAPLAFLAGRAVNPNVFSDVWVPNFEQGRYVPAVSLPLATPSRVLQPETDAAKAERDRVLAKLIASVDDLKARVSAAYLPDYIDSKDAALLIDHLKAVVVAPQPEGDAFDLSISERRMAFGRGLLDALATTADGTLERIAKLLFVHEVYHSRQNIRSTTYPGIGRAGLALEEIDFWADCVALWVAIDLELARNGGASVAAIARDYIQAALDGIVAFDRAEHGARIDDLAERRLRRYLIWSLELARALSVRTIEDVHRLLRSRLIVEIAPVRGSLDGRFDKQVGDVAHDAEVFVVLDRRLLRIQRQATINPKAMVEAVRGYDLAGLLGIMRAIRDGNEATLVPWVERIG